MLQARPETVRSRKRPGAEERYKLMAGGKLLASGRAIGQKIGAGPVRIVKDASKMASVQRGDVLVTDMTDPDWEPVMKRASAIVGFSRTASWKCDSASSFFPTRASARPSRAGKRA